MNVLVPVSDRTLIPRYLRAGVEEFCLGFRDSAWYERFGETARFDCTRGFWQRAGLCTFEDTLRAVDDVQRLGRELYVVFVLEAYSKRQLDYLYGYFEQLHDVGATGVVVSAPEAIEAASDSGLAVMASEACNVCNADIARFYRDLGCTHVLFPHDLSLAEIEAIVEAEPVLDYGVPLMSARCSLEECLCPEGYFQNRDVPCWDQCYVDRAFDVTGGPRRFGEAVRENNDSYRSFHASSCGLCALFRLLRAGISTAGVVGRADDPENVLHDIESVVENAEIAGTCVDEREFFERMHLPYGEVDTCDGGRGCRYPEVRFPRMAYRPPWLMDMLGDRLPAARS